jgi:hypothetical protein
MRGACWSDCRRSRANAPLDAFCVYLMRPPCRKVGRALGCGLAVLSVDTLRNLTERPRMFQQGPLKFTAVCGLVVID